MNLAWAAAETRTLSDTIEGLVEYEAFVRWQSIERAISDLSLAVGRPDWVGERQPRVLLRHPSEPL